MLNGGNHTGMLSVDPSPAVKQLKHELARVSAAPDEVKITGKTGIHMFRVDDIAYRVGCTTKPHGTRKESSIFPSFISKMEGVQNYLIVKQTSD